MFKSLLIASLTLSSLAIAAPGRFGPAPAPLPPAYRPFEAPRPVQEGPWFGHEGPWSEAPSFGRGRQDDRLDALRANQLLRAYDAALARRDFRAVRGTEMSFRVFLEQQLREARMEARGRGGERQLGRLSSIAADLSRLERRMDPRALMARRGLYADLAQLASRDVRGGWRA